MSKNKNITFKINSIFPFLILLSTIFMGIGYASINSITSEIKATVIAKKQEGVFITDVIYNSDNNANLTTSKINNYYQTVLNSHIELSKDNPSSSITYTVTIYNSSDSDLYFVKVKYDEQFYDNSNIIFKLDGIEPGFNLQSKQYITFNITFSYLEDSTLNNNVLNSYLNFEFKQKYNVTYVNFENNNYPTTIFEGYDLSVDLTLEQINDLTITQGEKVLINNVDYTFENNILLIKNVSDNITITNSQSSGPVLPPGKDFEVTFHDQGGGSGSYNYSISIKNTTDTASNGWKIYMIVPADTQISSSWGCEAKIENGLLIITNSSWNGYIPAGQTQGNVAGINLKTNDSSILPLKYTALKV